MNFLFFSEGNTNFEVRRGTRNRFVVFMKLAGAVNAMSSLNLIKKKSTNTTLK